MNMIHLTQQITHAIFRAGLAIVIAIAMDLASCKSDKNKEEENVCYTCSMDPQVMEKQPGKCPICKMELTRTEGGNASSNTLQFTESQMKLANIKVDTMKLTNMLEEISLTAKVVVDETESSVISTRVMGRIDKLYFKNLGEYISKGEVIYEVYSEELAAAQQDFLIAKERVEKLNDKDVDYKQLLSSAKNKLLLWGITEKQISQLEQSGQVPLLTPFYSPTDGYITEINSKEGDYVMQGQMIYKLNTLSSVWIEAQTYPSEISGFKTGQDVTITFDALPENVQKAEVTFISPELIQQSKINIVRAQLNNTKHNYFPGMLATITASISQKKAFILPLDAVLQEAKGNTVWIQNMDGTFESKMVTIGIQNSRQIEILSGINEGDRVVSSGAYLINSEYRLKKGASPMEGHDMKDMKM